MKKRNNKTVPKVGFKPIVGATRYTIKSGKKTKILDVFKPKNRGNV